MTTPVGAIFQERLFDPVLHSSASSRHFIQTPEDYQALLFYLRDITVAPDFTSIRKTMEELGEEGLPHTWVGRTPYQQLWTEWVSVQNLAPHMVEHGDLLGEVIAAMTDVQRRIFESACLAVKELDLPYVVIGDNITAPMIGPHYFRQYCVPLYNELADMLDATGKDVPVVVHMDGYLKPLWDAISETRVRGLDSMSPPPDNDTRVADAMALWPEMRVMINFPSSVHLHDEEAIYETALEILGESGGNGRLQIQVSEKTPPGRWRTSYPQIIKAIHEVGEVGV